MSRSIFYGMPGDWPGRAGAKNLPWHQRVTHVEQAMVADVADAVGVKFDKRQFVPYVQLHEFESLAFADVSKLAAVAAALKNFNASAIESHFSEILAEAGNAEAINYGHDTCPFRRITAYVPAFAKRLHSPMVVKRIGFQQLRKACAHFSNWVTTLEVLSPAR